MKRIAIWIILVGFPFITFSQFRPSSSGAALEYNKIARNVQFLKAGNMVTYSLDEINGYPQLFNEFKSGKITLQNDSIIIVPLNYNAFIDAFEFQREGISYILTNNFYVKLIEVENRQFVYRTYTNDKNIEQQGYLEVIVSGQNSLLKKNTKLFTEPITAETPFHNPKPAMFSDNLEVRYFIDNQFSEVSFLNVSSNKKVLSHFSYSNEELNRFIKESKLNVRKESDLILFINYLNTNFN